MKIFNYCSIPIFFLLFISTNKGFGQGYVKIISPIKVQQKDKTYTLNKGEIYQFNKGNSEIIFGHDKLPIPEIEINTKLKDTTTKPLDEYHKKELIKKEGTKYILDITKLDSLKLKKAVIPRKEDGTGIMEGLKNTKTTDLSKQQLGEVFRIHIPDYPTLIYYTADLEEHKANDSTLYITIMKDLEHISNPNNNNDYHLHKYDIYKRAKRGSNSIIIGKDTLQIKDTDIYTPLEKADTSYLKDKDTSITRQGTSYVINVKGIATTKMKKFYRVEEDDSIPLQKQTYPIKIKDIDNATVDPVAYLQIPNHVTLVYYKEDFPKEGRGWGFWVLMGILGVILLVLLVIGIKYAFKKENAVLGKWIKDRFKQSTPPPTGLDGQEGIIRDEHVDPSVGDASREADLSNYVTKSSFEEINNKLKEEKNKNKTLQEEKEGLEKAHLEALAQKEEDISTLSTELEREREAHEKTKNDFLDSLKTKRPGGIDLSNLVDYAKKAHEYASTLLSLLQRVNKLSKDANIPTSYSSLVVPEYEQTINNWLHLMSKIQSNNLKLADKPNNTPELVFQNEWYTRLEKSADGDRERMIKNIFIHNISDILSSVLVSAERYLRLCIEQSNQDADKPGFEQDIVKLTHGASTEGNLGFALRYMKIGEPAESYINNAEIEYEYKEGVERDDEQEKRNKNDIIDIQSYGFQDGKKTQVWLKK